MYRVVTEDTFIGEVKIPEGSNIMLGWGTAGRDPKYFDEIIGKKVSSDVEAGTATSWDVIEK